MIEGRVLFEKSQALKHTIQDIDFCGPVVEDMGASTPQYTQDYLIACAGELLELERVSGNRHDLLLILTKLLQQALRQAKGKPKAKAQFKRKGQTNDKHCA